MTRFTAGAIKKLKLTKGIDLTAEKQNWAGQFAVDPLKVAEVCYVLWEDQITHAGKTREDFEDSLDSDDIANLRSEVVRQMKGFSGSWMMAYTQMEAVQSGNTDLLSKLVEANLE